MRAVVSFALLLLVLAASFDFMSWSQDVEAERVENLAQRRSHRIRAFSSGWHFPPVQQGLTNQFEGALVDDRWFRAGGKEGLRVISIPADGGEVTLDNFRLMSADPQLMRFETLLGATKLNTTLVISCKQNLGCASFKEIREKPERVKKRVERVGFLLRGLGVRSNPENTRHCAFVYICVRRPWGFVRLAEKYSVTRGVSLSMNLDEDVTVYDDHVSRTVIDNRWLVALKSEWAEGEQLNVQGGRLFLKEMGYPSLRINLDGEHNESLTWDVGQACRDTISPGTKDKPVPVENLGAKGPVRFAAKLAWRFNPSKDPSALQFVLRVNGRRMGERVVLNGEAENERWILWEETLAGDIGTLESLEIEIQRVGEDGPQAVVHVAEVQLSSGEFYSF